MEMISETAGRIGGWLALGGPVVSVLAVVSVIALAIVMVKLVQFWRIGRTAYGYADRLAADIRHRGIGAAARTAGEPGGGPVTPVVAGALAALARGEEASIVREDAERLAARSLDDMQYGIRWLELIAQMAPLLGLFGTVLGMIEAFKALQQAGSQVDPSILAGGIWVALLTTAVGLAVAMPVSVAVSMLEARVRSEHRNLEDALTIVFTGAVAAQLHQAPAMSHDVHPGVPVHAA